MNIQELAQKHIEEYQDAAMESYIQNQCNLAAAEAIKRLLEEMETEEQGENPAPDNQEEVSLDDDQS